MKNQKLIIINGLPASGKSTIAEKLSKELHIPLFNKDNLKEILSDSMKIVSIRGSRRFNNPSIALLFYVTNVLLTYKFSVIIESNFKNESNLEEFKKKLETNNVKIIEIFCKTNGELLIERFTNRLNSRHLIHSRIMPKRFLKELRDNKLSPLSLGRVMEVDTSDFSKIPYKKIIKFIREK